MGVLLVGGAVATLAASSGASAIETSREGTSVSPRRDRRAVAGPEIAFPASGSGPVPYYQHSVSVASDGSGYLQVWDDERDDDGAELILGRLLDANGAPLGSDPLVLARNGACVQAVAAVAWDGTNYVVAWLTAQGLTENADILDVHSVAAVHVSQTGSVLDPLPTTVLTGLPGDVWGSVVVACRGAGCLFVAVDVTTADTESDLVAAFATTEPTLVASPQVTFGSGLGFAEAPSVAADAAGFLVAFEALSADYVLEGQRFGPAGNLDDAGVFALAEAQDAHFFPAVTTTEDGGDVVAWFDESQGLVMAQTWSVTGTATTPPITAGATAYTAALGAVSAGARVAVFYDSFAPSGSFDLSQAFISEDSEPVEAGTPGDLGVLADYVLGAATNGTGFVIGGAVYPYSPSASDAFVDNTVVHATSVSASGIVSDQVLSNAPFELRDGVIASNGRDYLMTAAQFDTQWRSTVARLSAAGELSVVGALAPSTFRFARAKADGAGNYLVATLTGDLSAPFAVTAYRVTDVQGGAPVLGPAITVRSEPYVPAQSNVDGAVDLACGPVNCLVVWSEPAEPPPAEGSASRFAVYGQLVGNDGSLVGPPVPMSTGPGEDLALPAVGYDGARYIVMYERLAGYYARTFDNGVLGPEIPLGVAAVGDGLTSGFIACRAPGDCLAAWEEQTPSSEFVNLVHVDAQGATAPPFPVDVGPAENPAVTFDGANYLVAWDTGTYGAPDAACDVYLTTIGGDGGSILAKTPIATSPDNEYFGFVAAMEPGAAAVVYTRMVNDPSVLVTRMFARFVTDAEDGGADAGAVDGGVVAEAGPPPVEGGADAGHEGTRDAGTIASPASGPSGCGCRAGAGGTNAVASLGALGALGAFVRGRRRRRQEAAR